VPSFENPFSFPRLAQESPDASSTAPEQVLGAPEDPNEVVLVDGAIRGLSTSRLSLAEFFEAPSFKECFFETASGNIYGIIKIPAASSGVC